MKLLTKRIKLNLFFKLSYLNSNFELILGHLNPALNNLSSAHCVRFLLPYMQCILIQPTERYTCIPYGKSVSQQLGP